MKRLASALVVAVSFGLNAFGQVTMIGASIEPQLFTPKTFLSVSVSNPGPSVPVVLSGELRSEGGEPVLTFRSEEFLLNTGVQQVRSASLIMREFTLGAGPLGRAASIDRRLPAGKYGYCLRIRSDHDPEAQDELCDPFESEDRAFMDLVYPIDGDTIDELRPALSWTITMGKVPVGQIARMLLVPMDSEMDANASIISSRPIFAADRLGPLVVPFPMGVPDLERGKCYAWQVERYLNGASIDRTESWKFCVRKRKEIDPDRYVLVGPHVSNSVAEAIQERLYVKLDGLHGQAPSCRVFRWDGIAVVPGYASLEKVRPMLTRTGSGLYEVDLAICGLKAGVYTLELQIPEEQPRLLRFRISN